MSKADVQRSVESEIVGERAGAMARAMEALEAALHAWREAPPAHRQDLLEEAGELLWFVVVQREALGLARHEVVYEVLKVPGEVRRAMGPRRRRGVRARGRSWR
ncbi:MAG TPA: DUF6665 family protein [Myxococcales bacterium]